MGDIITDIMLREGWDMMTNDPLDKGGRTQFGISEKSNPLAWTDNHVTEAEARAICLRTIKHAWRDHKGDYLTFLAKRYCPVNWRVWLKNITYFYNKEAL